LFKKVSFCFIGSITIVVFYFVSFFYFIMLFTHWKVEYSVPNITYNYENFKSDRKAKFYFLSDLVFNFIHKYCFRRVLYHYISFLFRKRLILSCIQFKNSFFRDTSYFDTVKLKNDFVIKTNLNKYKINIKW